MALQLRRAERKQAKMRVGITAPSGGGKTYSALRLARGLASAWEKVAVIDTENGSAELYSHLGPYNVLTLPAPYTPERYIDAIRACEQAGMDVIVIDSATHEWDGPGGCLEINEKLANTKFKGNTWAAWSETTPRHRAFITALVSSGCHVITTTRSKTDTIQTDDKKVKKIGLKEIQREGYEYELTVNFALDRDSHYAMPSKDRTELFEGKVFLITEETGREMKSWCESGAVTAPDVTPVPQPEHAPPTPIRVVGVQPRFYKPKDGPATPYWAVRFSDGIEATTIDRGMAELATRCGDEGVEVDALIVRDKNKIRLTELTPINGTPCDMPF